MAEAAGTLHVVIVGGGFAGLGCAQRLAGEQGVRATLIDRNPHHQFQPLLYQVASAELTPEDVKFDLEKMFQHTPNIAVRTGEVVAVDPDTRTVTLADQETISGDVLVLAAGSQVNFFRTPGAETFAFPLYTLEDAGRLRRRVLELFAAADAKPEMIDEGVLTFVVVGGGPTGVETAGALGELAHNVMPHVYPQLAVAGVRVILIDLGHSVLAPFSEKAHDYAAAQLRRRGVEIRLGISVKEVADDHVLLSDGSRLDTHLVVWGGGIGAAALAGKTDLPRGRGGRIDVRPDLTVEGYPNVYALGDFANIPYGDDHLPQLGSVAQQSGTWAADNILAGLEGGTRQSFHYHDKGIMAMIGRKAAVAEIGEKRHELDGRIAFSAWLGVHAQLLSTSGAELRAFLAWAEEFYVRPHHRTAELLDPSKIDVPRIHWDRV